MLVALIMVAVVAASLLFHFLSPWRLTPIASNWGYIDNMMGATFWITAAGFVAVILFMAYCLFRFRHKEGRRAAYEPENQKLEGWLAIGTTIAVVALLAPGLFVWGQFINVPEGAMEVEAMGQQWQWSFRFPGADNRLGATDALFIDANNPYGLNPNDPRGQDDILASSGDLHLPIGKPIKMLLRSIDVLHDFYVPEIPRQDGSGAGDRHLFLVHSDEDRRVRDSVRRVLRHWTSADARQGRHRIGRRLQDLARGAADLRAIAKGRRGSRPTGLGPMSAAPSTM